MKLHKKFKLTLFNQEKKGHKCIATFTQLSGFITSTKIDWGYVCMENPKGMRIYIYKTPDKIIKKIDKRDESTKII